MGEKNREKAGYAIEVNEDSIAPSSYLLDLKKRKEKKRSPASKTLNFDAPKKNLNWQIFIKDLFLFEFLSALFKIIVFLPRRLFGASEKLGRKIKNILKTKLKSISASRKEKRRPILERKFSAMEFNPPQYWFKGLAAFILIAFVMALPLQVFSSFEGLQNQKDAVIEQSFQGYEQLKNSDFTSASISFASAKKTIDDLGFVFNHLLAALPGVGDKLSFGTGLLMFGENFANAAALLQEALNYFDKDVVLTDKIKNLTKKVNEAMPHLLIADRVLNTLNNSYSILPIDINPFKKALHDSIRALLVYRNFSDTLLEILGDKHFKRYLIVFQNNNELRPTGGFMGSFALVDIDRGEIKQIEVPGGGSYDIQGQLRELVISPEPFHLIKSAWQFQDSNWFPDFPTSAKKIMWFYEKSEGSSVDGVVAINSILMEELLRIIGPIEMLEYGRTMTADNFVEETQKIVELEYDKAENKPKQIIADMMPKVLERLFKINAKDVSRLSQAIHEAVLDKDILVYSKNEETQTELETFGLSGKLKDIKNFTDYLLVVDTNIAGQKTDGKIIKEIEHFSEIAEDGAIVNTVKITRRHTGIKGALFSGVRNVNYLRLYVPLGSKLLSIDGFEAPPGNLFKKIEDGYVKDKDLERIQGTVYVEPKTGTRINNEFGRTVFGNWTMVDPGQEATVTFKYKLPYKLNAAEKNGFQDVLISSLGLSNNFINYKILIEKQPGAKNTTFKSHVKADGKRAVARVGADVALQNDGWQYESKLDSDKYYGVVIED